MPFAQGLPLAIPLELSHLVAYVPGQIVRKTLAQNPGMTIFIYAVFAGETITAQTQPGYALLQILQGRARIAIAGQHWELDPGQSMILPGNQPHAIYAPVSCKMLLTAILP